jgi:hypothetical protein
MMRVLGKRICDFPVPVRLSNTDGEQFTYLLRWSRRGNAGSGLFSSHFLSLLLKALVVGRDLAERDLAERDLAERDLDTVAEFLDTVAERDFDALASVGGKLTTDWRE